VQLAIGHPAEGYPFDWTVYEWLPGDNANGTIEDLDQAAVDLAAFVRALRQADPTDAHPRPARSRGAPLAELDKDETTSSEMMSAHLKEARLVKGFNTIYFKHLATQGDSSKSLEERRAIFIAGDDSEAKEIVARLIEEIGFAAVDTGLLHEGGRSQQPGTPVYNKDLTAKEAVALLSANRIAAK